GWCGGGGGGGVGRVGGGADDEASGSMSGRVPRSRPGWMAILGCAFVLGVASARAALQEPLQPALPDVEKLGPQVGTRVPDFTLHDQNGGSRTLNSLMGPKGLM